MKVHCCVQPLENLGAPFGFQTLGEGAVEGITTLVIGATRPVC